MNNLKRLAIVTTFFSVSLSTSQVASQTCPYATTSTQTVEPGLPVTGGHSMVNNAFAHYARLWCYTGTNYINKYWYGYGFIKPTWSSGYGYGEACSLWYKPLHRMLSAIRFIDYVSAINLRYKGTTTWYSMTKNNIDETRANCANGTKSARMDTFSNMYIYVRGMYYERAGIGELRGNSVGELASLIVHESRHAWSWHNGESCGSCDESWSDSDVMYNEIRFLWDVYKFSPYRTSNNIGPSTTVNRNNLIEYHMSEPQLDLMRDKGNYKISERFDTTPTFRIGPRVQPWVISE